MASGKSCSCTTLRRQRNSRTDHPTQRAIMSRDRELGMFREITRRDFLNGVAVGTAAAASGTFLPSLACADSSDPTVPQDRPGYYPPTLTGLRGSHAGSFEAAHSLRDGKSS